jgi:ribonuclease HI
MTGLEILDYARNHDWCWCIYAGTDEDCHGRICRLLQGEEYQELWTEEEKAFWEWVKHKHVNDEHFKCPDQYRRSLLEWCLQDKGLREIWARIQQEEATARFAEARATAIKVAANGELAREVIQKRIKEQKHQATLAKRRAKYHQKRLGREFEKLLERPAKLEISTAGNDFHPDRILEKHSEWIRETERRMNE